MQRQMLRIHDMCTTTMHMASGMSLGNDLIYRYTGNSLALCIVQYQVLLMRKELSTGMLYYHVTCA